MIPDIYHRYLRELACTGSREKAESRVAWLLAAQLQDDKTTAAQMSTPEGRIAWLAENS